MRRDDHRTAELDASPKSVRLLAKSALRHVEAAVEQDADPFGGGQAFF